MRKYDFVVPSQCKERRKKMWAGSEEAFKAFDEMPRFDFLVRADRVDWHWQGQRGNSNFPSFDTKCETCYSTKSTNKQLHF